ncbi:uncharacterized protein PV06_10161 [Exophiala oligosperma]|uniref:Ras modification protein ERF4 n=1 Tax=Exophiala oligosperma TaxID=215243 RepID=A0A0D2D2J2_9EURO|nr:uncharacterized protein PV06_10161 [Exophiala oligosperma]KIW37508.1 hypothetical protein PV06_10161 [Exophiala oligosperma]
MVDLPLLLATLCLWFANQATAQADVDQCALTCIANVNGTNCSQSQWPCLCANDMYIERMNNCTIASCNATAQQDTFTVVAQLCAIFDVPLTIGPEATVPISSSDLLFSTVAIPTQSSLPPVITSNGASASSTTVSNFVPAYTKCAVSFPRPSSCFYACARCYSTVAASPNLPNPSLPQISAADSSSITDASNIPRSHLSPRALEKQPVRDARPAITSSSLDRPIPPVPAAAADPGRPAAQGPDPLLLTSSSAARPPVTEHAPFDLSPSRPHTTAQSQRRSFLEALLARPTNKKVLPPDHRSATSRILNPINHVPRPTKVRVQPQELQHNHQHQSSAEIGSGEVHTLLSLPEQRRSRQHSPTDPIVEHSPHLAPQAAGSRTSVGLPHGHQRAANVQEPPSSSPPGIGLMVDLEKQGAVNGIKEPEQRSQLPSRFSTRDRKDVVDQGTSVLGQSYGVNPLDQPLQPPRRITSHHSLRRAQSAASIHSAGFTRANTDGTAPVSGSQEEETGPGYPGVEEGSVGEELVWGISHPCFPHLNPHVPINSPEYEATRIIRIRRDWMVLGDLAPTFSNIYPEILDPLMQEQEFRYVIEHINQTLVQAYDPFSAWNWFDGFMGLMTGWFWEDFRPTGLKGQLKGLEEWLEDWNHTVGARDGVKIIPLRRTGYMNIDIQIPDPQVRVVGDGDVESQQPPPTAQAPDTNGGPKSP